MLTNITTAELACISKSIQSKQENLLAGKHMPAGSDHSFRKLKANEKTSHFISGIKSKIGGNMDFLPPIDGC
jgi:hypothetical protein